MSEFRFATPLWWLAVVPVVAILCWPRKSGAIVFSSAQLVQQLPQTWAVRSGRWLPWVRLVACLLLLAALARPQWGWREFRVQTEGVAIMAAIDRSGSMLALDFELNGERVDRLTAVKHVVREFVTGSDQLPGRSQDLIGLVTFGGYAEGRVPLTLDHPALLDVLETVEVAQPVYDQEGQMLNARFLEDEQSTAIGDALALAVERIRHSDAQSKVIVFLSDGENTAGVLSPEDAAKLAAQFGIKVYTIGIGRTGRVPFPVRDPQGNTFYQARFVRLDEATLKHLAAQTGGEYFHADDTDTLQRVYQEIDRLERSVAEGEVVVDYREAFHWPLIPAIAMLVGESLLRWTRLRSWP